MAEHLDELSSAISSAGGALRLYGKPIDVADLRKHAAGSVAARMRGATTGIAHTPGKLPVPRLTATITPPVNRGGFGVVHVHGYVVTRCDGDPPSELAPRSNSLCSICDKPGHVRSNRKFHPPRDV